MMFFLGAATVVYVLGALATAFLVTLNGGGLGVCRSTAAVLFWPFALAWAFLASGARR